uniref:Uncharacterized protein n=1 Tax=Arundo donax TaxID=35708 RepID=A0A0A8YZI8_ARUDO
MCTDSQFTSFFSSVKLKGILNENLRRVQSLLSGYFNFF